jgi:phage nucleotide-binding protein
MAVTKTSSFQTCTYNSEGGEHIGKNDELEKLMPTSSKLGSVDVGAVDEMAPWFNMLIYGEPGVGKTWLAGSAAAVEEMSPVLFIDIEGGTLTLRNPFPQVEVARVKSYEEMAEVYGELRKGDHKYKTVVLDSLTEIQKFSMYRIMQALAESDPDRDPDVPGMREWGKNIEQIRRTVRLFRDLPMNVIFTALANFDKDAKTGLIKTKPSLSGKLANEVAGFVDIVMYYYIKNIDGENQRLLLTAATDTVVAKDRTGRLPEVFEQPTMQTLYNTAFNKE